MYKINMMSKADVAKGHGVLSAHDEQVALVRDMLGDSFEVMENARGTSDITHYHSINPEFLAGVPFHKKKGTTVGYVHFLPETVENSIRLPGLARKLFYWYMIAFYKRMDHLVTVNPYFIDALQKYGVPREKITYIPNVVSEERFCPLPMQRRRKVRREYGLEEEKFTVLSVGQLQKRKGVMDFIRIAQSMPEIQFVWAGGFSFGKISDGYDEIRQALKDLPDNVRFLGMVERERMNDIYNMADVMFLASYEELFPMTILEAMNCGLPIVVRDLEIYQPILFDYVLKGNTDREFKILLKRLSMETGFYMEAAHQSFAGHKFYSREHVAQLWRQYYLSLVAGKTEIKAAEN